MFTAVAAELTTPALAARLGYRRLLMGGLVLLGAPALVLPARRRCRRCWSCRWFAASDSPSSW